MSALNDGATTRWVESFLSPERWGIDRLDAAYHARCGHIPPADHSQAEHGAMGGVARAEAAPPAMPKPPRPLPRFCGCGCGRRIAPHNVTGYADKCPQRFRALRATYIKHSRSPRCACGKEIRVKDETRCARCRWIHRKSQGAER